MQTNTLGTDPFTSNSFLDKVLGERHVEKTVVATYYEDLDRIMSEGSQPRPWQSFELTQREDVREWVHNPVKIEKIQASLDDLASRLHRIPESPSILDVGCYGGYLYDYLYRLVYTGNEGRFTYTGVDIQPDVVEAAALIHKDRRNATFKIGDVYALANQFGENQFDVVVCSRVLIHIPYFEKAVRELYAVAKKAAVIVLEIADRPLMQRIHRKNLDNGLELDYFFRKYSEQEIRSAASNLGADFRIIKSAETYSTVILNKP